MKIKRKKWMFFIGYDVENDWYGIIFKWGGRLEYRALDGMFHYRREWKAGFRLPLEWFERLSRFQICFPRFSCRFMTYDDDDMRIGWD